MSKEVALVLHENVPGLVESVAARMPVWLVDSPGNAVVARKLRRASNSMITTFSRKDGEANADLAERIVYSLDQHHDETSQDVPYDTLLVLGMSLAEARKASFLDLGFSEFEEADFGFVARKRK